MDRLVEHVRAQDVLRRRHVAAHDPRVLPVPSRGVRIRAGRVRTALAPDGERRKVDDAAREDVPRADAARVPPDVPHPRPAALQPQRAPRSPRRPGHRRRLRLADPPARVVAPAGVCGQGGVEVCGVQEGTEGDEEAGVVEAVACGVHVDVERELVRVGGEPDALVWRAVGGRGRGRGRGQGDRVWFGGRYDGADFDVGGDFGEDVGADVHGEQSCGGGRRRRGGRGGGVDDIDVDGACALCAVVAGEKKLAG